jgi:hypothetical protein
MKSEIERASEERRFKTPCMKVAGFVTSRSPNARFAVRKALPT